MKGYLMLILIIFSFSIFAQPTFKIRGIITDDDTKMPIRNAKISMTDSCGKTYIDSTDVKGRFFFDSINICSQRYVLFIKSFRKECYGDYKSFKQVYNQTTLTKDTVKIALGIIHDEIRVPIYFFKLGQDSLENPEQAEYSLKKIAELVNCDHDFLISFKSFMAEDEYKTFGEQLSNKRIFFVKNELIRSGIPSRRIRNSTSYAKFNKKESDPKENPYGHSYIKLEIFRR